MTYKEILDAMTAEFASLSGFYPDQASDVGLRMKVLASQLFELSLKQDYLLEQMFPQTASGRYLDLQGETRGVPRREAVPSVGKLSFGRQSPASFDVPIPAGTICTVSRDPSLRFETAEEAVLSAGALSVEIPARSVEGGARYNVAAGAVDVLVAPPQGISLVANPAPFSGGEDREGDDSLRSRIVKSFRTVSNGTNAAFYYDGAMEYEGVLHANVLPRARGRGTVDVIVSARKGVDETGLLARMQEDFSKAKEINVDVRVLAAKQVPVSCSVQAAVEDGYIFSAVSAEVERAVRAYCTGVGIGESIRRAALVSAVYAVPGVANCVLEEPMADLSQSEDSLFVLESVTVTEMAVRV